jgi:hypothetical protein
MEETCEFVSTFGILRSCEFYQGDQESQEDFFVRCVTAKEGDTLAIPSGSLQSFVSWVLPLLQAPVRLVCSHSDIEMPFGAISQTEFQSLVESPQIVRVYCQNLTLSHPKIRHIPIGLDYHTLRNHIGMMHPWGPGCMPAEQEKTLLSVRQTMIPNIDRRRLCYSNFHHAAFGINQRGDRQELLQKVPHSLIHFAEQYVSRESSWRHQTGYAFVLSPRGGGYDCHRTWEALLLGCIPIVKRSGMDPVFADLPVLLVDDWSDITEELLEKTQTEFSTKEFDRKKLCLTYWISHIRM